MYQPCLNGGICEDLPYEYNCICPAGYEGVNCEISMMIYTQLTMETIIKFHCLLFF